MKITPERLRQITTVAANADVRVTSRDPLYLESKAMAEEILTLREDLSKAFRQIQFRVDERELARAGRAEALAARDEMKLLLDHARSVQKASEGGAILAVQDVAAERDALRVVVRELVGLVAPLVHLWAGTGWPGKTQPKCNRCLTYDCAQALCVGPRIRELLAQLREEENVK